MTQILGRVGPLYLVPKSRRIAAGARSPWRGLFTQSLYPGEIAQCGGRAERLAARFAAKEAVAKAFGTGIGRAMAFHEIEVTNQATGQPAIALHGAAAATAAARGSPSIHLSLSHTATYAIAFVVVAG